MEYKDIKERLQPIMLRYPIKRLALFGSQARHEATAKSDIDLLIDITQTAQFSLLDFIKLKHEMENALQTSVDLVEYSTIKPRIKERILQEQIQLF